MPGHRGRCYRSPPSGVLALRAEGARSCGLRLSRHPMPRHSCGGRVEDDALALASPAKPALQLAREQHVARDAEAAGEDGLETAELAAREAQEIGKRDVERH